MTGPGAGRRPDQPVVDSVIVYSDGGSRGNPGPAGYGSVVLAADGRTVLAERAASLGVVTNNVAEYSGLIAGLEAAAALGARTVAVRLDSKLVVEQLSGRWKVKHPDMKPLAAKASRLAAQFDSITFDWVPRAQNSHADALANAAMDAAARGEQWSAGDGTPGAPAVPAVVPLGRIAQPGQDGELDRAAQPGQDGEPDRTARPGLDGQPDRDGEWDLFSAGPADQAAHADPAAGLPDPHPSGATTILVIRHGETTWGALGRFAGRQDVPLTERGRRQAQAVARRLAPLRPGVVLSSPLARCRATAEIIAAAIRAEVTGAGAIRAGAMRTETVRAGATGAGGIGTAAMTAGTTADAISAAGPGAAGTADPDVEVGPAVRVADGLLDGLLGTWTGLTAAQIEEGWPAEFAIWRSDVDAAPPGGESFTEIRARVAAVLRDTVATYPGQTIVLVTHAATTKMLVAEALGTPSDVAYRLRVDTASLSAFTVEQDGPIVVWAVNETGHLIP